MAQGRSAAPGAAAASPYPPSPPEAVPPSPLTKIAPRRRTIGACAPTLLLALAAAASASASASAVASSSASASASASPSTAAMAAASTSASRSYPPSLLRRAAAASLAYPPGPLGDGADDAAAAASRRGRRRPLLLGSVSGRSAAAAALSAPSAPSGILDYARRWDRAIGRRTSGGSRSSGRWGGAFLGAGRVGDGAAAAAVGRGILDEGGEESEEEPEDEIPDDDEDLSLSSLLEGEAMSVDDGGGSPGDDERDGTTPTAEVDELADLPRGKPDGFRVVHRYSVPRDGFDLSPDAVSGLAFTPEDAARLSLSGENVTLPVALMILDPELYPSQSKARKACRQGTILVHRGPLVVDEATGEGGTFDPDRCIRGRVGDRVYPGDVVAKQVRMVGGFYPSPQSSPPPFDLPVVYEDDHFAVVNKPAGVVVNSHRKGGHGRMTVKSALPYVLRPPRRGTASILRRPIPVHRLDRPTSGLLLVAKTKPAMVDLTRQFVERRVRKTYTAIVNGVPDESRDAEISAREARDLGVDVDPTGDGRGFSDGWQVVDHALDGKSAVTVWRPLRYAPSLKAKDGTLTLAELKPKTGRYHQLRRHMAWVCRRPLAGDAIYSGGVQARYFKDRGLFLCSNKVVLEHPYYNCPEGRAEWEAKAGEEDRYRGGSMRLAEDEETVLVDVSIDLPKKFLCLLDWEEERAKKFNDEESS